MKINRQGGTRTVFVFKNIVIKIPNMTYSWRNFLRGMIANIDEGRAWAFSEHKELLCPIRWYSFTGLVLIMEKADVELHYNEVKILFNVNYYDTPVVLKMKKDWREDFYKEWISKGHDDIKPDNFGYYKKRLVKIDYA